MGRSDGPKGLALVSLHALGGYLYGSVPFVYLMAKSRGIDLKSAGSKNVGAANLFSLSKSLPLATAAWTLDLSKGALPPLLAKMLLPKDTKTARMAAAAGAVSGVLGQCWPIFLSFSGGRGVAPIIGASSTLAPGLAPYLFASMAAGGSLRIASSLSKPGERRLLPEGKNSRVVPLCVGLSIAALPPAMLRRGYPRESVLAASANALILFLRRATAGGLPAGKDGWGVILNRLLYDRSEV